MNEMRIGMKSTLTELEKWEEQNPELPEVVKDAIWHHKADLRRAIENLSKHPFVVGDEVEFSVTTELPRTGIVVRVRTEHLPPDGHIRHSALVSWDDKPDDHQWIPAEDLNYIQEAS